MSYDEGPSDVQRLAGLGPPSAQLIMIRRVGVPHAPPSLEKRFEAAARAAYHPGDSEPLAATAEGWLPCRSWAAC